ncbi:MULTISPECIES: hypothetical protein [unclassified Haloferax]|uniref:hypothetical protein n=1 Tax=unclassified Haloferax TaxID=2625095 RepID=UPI00287568FF|nr:MULTISPECIES: hypothetical protein [unclassified Haloferax]MDS0243168.1 hypothetical protein [Haloferax sp. S2CR25]MDS0446289.1 hypothetical protein [Haloferax sp. S2CR25-2]
MPVDPVATEKQLKQTYRSIRRMNNENFEDLFRECLTELQTIQSRRVELAFGVELQNGEVVSIGEPIKNERDSHGHLTRFYSHKGTDFAIHLSQKSGLETHNQLRALLMYELADAIEEQGNMETVSFQL